MDEKKYIRALEQVLLKRYPQNYFCVGRYQESAVCIEKNDTGWIVYVGERNQKQFEVDCVTILEACLELFKKLVSDRNELAVIENEFMKLLNDVA